MSTFTYILFNIVVYLVLIKDYQCFPDQGKWSFSVREKKCHFFEVHSALYKNSVITIKVTCDPGYKSPKLDTKINLGWVVRKTPCFEEYLGPELSMPDYLTWYYSCPSQLLGDFGYNQVEYLKTEEIEVDCNHIIHLTPVKEKFVVYYHGINKTTSCVPAESQKSCDSSPVSPFISYFSNYYGTSSSNKRSIPNTNAQSNQDDDLSERDSINSRRKRELSSLNKTKGDHQVQIPTDGVYLLVFFMSITKENFNDRTFNATVDIEMKGEHGYLSAVDRPLLYFYGFMCIIYVGYAIGWLVVSFLQWRDLLRIQFWIGAVIFLGMFEKAVFYAEYQSINSTGLSVKGAIFFAEVLSCLKRTLARMLIIIVSCGFGIVKPRLGPILHRVICVGGLYFVLGSVEAGLRIYKPKNDPSNQTLMAGIPLAVLDSVICWWVFSSLVQTTRTLRLRKNIVKLNLYKQFTNTLIFAVLASIAFMLWQIHQHKLTTCLSDWNELWLDDAYWHILFSIVLLVIMILWRPTNNNQRYAFTPLLDMSDDEEDLKEPQISYEPYAGMKIRQHNNSISHEQQNNTSNAHITKESVITKETEENLKWIEDNIKTSLIDAALPALIDSDEEIMTTKFERNKME